MRILELDAGNSRLKWRLLNAGGIVTHGYLGNNDNWQYELNRLMSPIGQIDCARASIVSGNEHFELLSASIDRYFSIPLFIAEVKPEWQGVCVAYPGLGVDRWLAMLAAHHHALNDKQGKDIEGKNKLVVDCGTAMTIDFLSYRGEHHGGFIMPGVGLMKKTLHTSTALLQSVERPASEVLPGKNSADCINNGVLAMSVAMINSQRANYENSVVYLTGGDSALIERHIRGECIYRPELVMDGLALAFEEVTLR